jgi:hypothetical protein
VTTLHDLANAISGSSPNIKAFALAVADKLEPVAPPPPPPPPPSGFEKGINGGLIFQSNPGAFLDGHKDLKLTHHRTDWLGGNAGGKSQAWKDAIADALRARGLRLVPVMYSFTDHAAVLADIARYGPGGSHACYTRIEPGNEPYFDGTGVANYARNTLSLIQALRAAGNPIEVTVAAFRGSWIDDLEKNAPGLLAASSSHSVHNYCNRVATADHDPTHWTGSDFQFQMFRNVHDRLTAHGQGNKRIYSGEYGWHTAGSYGNADGDGGPSSLADQARFIGSGAAILRSFPYIGGGYLYDLDDWNAPADPEANYGLRKANGSHKPSYATYAAA